MTSRLHSGIMLKEHSARSEGNTMNTTFEVPEFGTEAEEASWRFDNQELVTDEFLRAAEEGRLEVDGTAKRASGYVAVVRLDP